MKGTSETDGTTGTPGRLGTSGTTEINGTSGVSEPGESTQNDESGPWDAPLKELDNVSFYLTEGMHDDLEIAQDLANAAY